MWFFEYAWPTGHGSIRRYGLVGGSVSLWGVESEAPPSGEESVFSWLQSDQDVELSAPPEPFLLGYCHALTLTTMD